MNNENNKPEPMKSDKQAINRKCWSIIRSKKKEQAKMLPLQKDGQAVSHNKDNTELLNKYYHSVFTTEKTSPCLK